MILRWFQVYIENRWRIFKSSVSLGLFSYINSHKVAALSNHHVVAFTGGDWCSDIGGTSLDLTFRKIFGTRHRRQTCGYMWRMHIGRMGSRRQNGLISPGQKQCCFVPLMPQRTATKVGVVVIVEVRHFASQYDQGSGIRMEHLSFILDGLTSMRVGEATIPMFLGPSISKLPLLYQALKSAWCWVSQLKIIWRYF